ncbi:hypothetical protein QJS10_CPA05g01558 [Acorus calamus]|uniref:Allene oxide synthase n=1 Tax=Acorus calamus TaxID=4465 RepID=A0AAV9ESE8_ACOCL|nr:hypothetical protein QJS10_CPA05g01558 [Acorus calamus]
MAAAAAGTTTTLNHRPKPTPRLHCNRPITIRCSVSNLPKTPHQSPPSDLPLRKIPGDYGLPLLGQIRDRFDYFYNQGRDDFLKSRIQKHGSTVFRVNMPPGRPVAKDPRVITLLDAASFPVLFDLSKVDKRDLFTGTFMPSTAFTGGYRVLSYLDPSEPNHAKLKRFLFHLLSSRRDHVVPSFQSCYADLFASLESDLASKGKADFNSANEQTAFDFLGRALLGKSPQETALGTDGPGIINKWVVFQLAPILTVGLPKVAEDVVLHSFRLPPSLVKSDYERLYRYFYECGSSTYFEEAEREGISKDEACHNVVFATCFNSWGGMKIFFPNVLKWIGRAGAGLHARLAEEVRSAVRANGGRLSMRAIESMELTKSVVYESLRIDPPVPLQYGRAKRDFVLKSHDAAFEVKEGELLFGYQPFATKDPRVFDRAEEFVADRFVGEEGGRLLKHVLWSNGPEDQHPTVDNKQCAGKDFVVLISRLLVAELFLRYDSFEIETSNSVLGSAITVTSLKRASF